MNITTHYKFDNINNKNQLFNYATNEYDAQLKSQTKILNNFDDVDDTFTSILSKAGKNNKLADALDASVN